MNNENNNNDKIKYCDILKYKCPLLWKNLKETSNPKIRFCDECKKNVYHVKNKADLEQSLKEKKCVMFAMADIEDLGSPAFFKPIPIKPEKPEYEEEDYFMGDIFIS